MNTTGIWTTDDNDYISLERLKYRVVKFCVDVGYQVLAVGQLIDHERGVAMVT